MKCFQVMSGTGEKSIVRGLVLAFAFLSLPVLADGIRCGNKLVLDGDTQTEVRAKCGEPSDIEVRTIMRRPTYRRNGRLIPYGREQVEKRVEFWTYNFGPNKFMRRIRFVDGVAEEIETLGYGHTPKEK